MYYRLTNSLSSVVRSTVLPPGSKDPNAPDVLAVRAQLKAKSPLTNLIKTPIPQTPLRRYTVVPQTLQLKATRIKLELT